MKRTRWMLTTNYLYFIDFGGRSPWMSLISYRCTKILIRSANALKKGSLLHLLFLTGLWLISWRLKISLECANFYFHFYVFANLWHLQLWLNGHKAVLAESDNWAEVTVEETVWCKFPSRNRWVSFTCLLF